MRDRYKCVYSILSRTRTPLSFWWWFCWDYSSKLIVIFISLLTTHCCCWEICSQLNCHYFECNLSVLSDYFPVSSLVFLILLTTTYLGMGFFFLFPFWDMLRFLELWIHDRSGNGYISGVGKEMPGKRGNWEYNGGVSNVGSEQDVWSTVWGWSVVEMKASEDEVWTL